VRYAIFGGNLAPRIFKLSAIFKVDWEKITNTASKGVFSQQLAVGQ
jgi:hypothetical protein